MIECERLKTNPQKMQHKTATNILWYGWMFMFSTMEASVFMEKNYSDNLRSIKKYRRRSHNENRCSTYLKSWEPNKQMRSMEWIQLIGVIPHVNILSLISGEESRQSLRAQRFTYFQILCYALERWTRSQHQILFGKTSGLVSRVSSQHETLDTIDGEVDGIRVEYFHRIHHIAALLQSPRVHVENEHTTTRFHWTDFLLVDVQRHLIGISRK